MTKQHSSKSFPELGIAILSWKSPITVDRTLSALSSNLNLNDFADTCIYFQEISKQDKEIAEKHRIRYVGNDHNIGIQEGIANAISNIHAKYIIFLECDFFPANNPSISKQLITTALNELKDGDVDIYRLRDWGDNEIISNKSLIFWPNEGGKDSLKQKLMRYFRPEKAQRMIWRSSLITIH